METGSETEEDDKLLVSEEDGLLNGAASPSSVANHDAGSPLAGHALLTKHEDDDDDDMRDSGVDHVWHESDMLRASVDGTGEFYVPSIAPLSLSPLLRLSTSPITSSSPAPRPGCVSGVCGCQQP